MDISAINCTLLESYWNSIKLTIWFGQYRTFIMTIHLFLYAGSPLFNFDIITGQHDGIWFLFLLYDKDLRKMDFIWNKSDLLIMKNLYLSLIRYMRSASCLSWQLLSFKSSLYYEYSYLNNIMWASFKKCFQFCLSGVK